MKISYHPAIREYFTVFKSSCARVNFVGAAVQHCHSNRQSQSTRACRVGKRTGVRVCESHAVNPLSSSYFKRNQPFSDMESACSAIKYIAISFHKASNANESFQLAAAANRVGHLIKNQSAGPYSYDAYHRLNQVSDTQNNAIARYTYDPFNRRLSKEQYRDAQGNLLAAPKRTYYFYADEGLIAESEQAIQVAPDASISAAQMPQINTQYIPQPGGLFTTGYLAIKTKSLSGSQAGQTIYAYYHHDHLSTSIRATDKAGNTVWSANHNAFGRAQINTAQTSIVSNLRLPGQYYDEESGLHQNWNRYYDSLTGRYVTEDPIGLLGGSNRYTYAGGNPLYFSDPNGLVFAPGVIAGAVLGGVGGAISTLYVNNGNIGWSNAGSLLANIASGALVGSGVGLVTAIGGSAVAGAGFNALGQVADNSYNNGSGGFNPYQSAIAGAFAGMAGGWGQVASGAGGTLAFKVFADTFGTLQGVVGDVIGGTLFGKPTIGVIPPGVNPPCK